MDIGRQLKELEQAEYFEQSGHIAGAIECYQKIGEYGIAAELAYDSGDLNNARNLYMKAIADYDKKGFFNANMDQIRSLGLDSEVRKLYDAPDVGDDNLLDMLLESV